MLTRRVLKKTTVLLLAAAMTLGNMSFSFALGGEVPAAGSAAESGGQTEAAAAAAETGDGTEQAAEAEQEAVAETGDGTEQAAAAEQEAGTGSGTTAEQAAAAEQEAGTGSGSAEEQAAGTGTESDEASDRGASAADGDGSGAEEPAAEETEAADGAETEKKAAAEEAVEKEAAEAGAPAEADAGPEDQPEDESEEAADGAEAAAEADGTGASDDTADEPRMSFSAAEEDLFAVQFYDEAALSREDALAELRKGSVLGEEETEDLLTDLFDAPVRKDGAAAEEEDDEAEYPRQGDGSNIENIDAKWVTEDTVDNGEDALLYYKPSGDDAFSVRLRVSYALSGEHAYEPGDITITVPLTILKDREGKDYSGILTAYPEEPQRKADFNWKQVGDTIVLTNTKKMSAATKGYMQFAFDELIPHELVDMQESGPFTAKIEIVTHKGNIIAAESNALTAQFDTEAKVTDVNKKVYGEVQRVPASDIPESQRVDGEEEYIKVNWYVWGETLANTLYTLTQIDTMPDEYDGFVIGATSANGLTLQKNEAYKGWDDGQTSYYYFATAYPASQFEAGVDYTFHNHITFRVTEADPAATITNPNVQAEDPRLVTEAEADAQVVWRYEDPEWQDPQGHFMLTKNGNDNKARNNHTRHKRYQYDTSDLHIWARKDPINGWYGIYPSAINDMQDDKEVLLSYTIDSVGYVMPWMFDTGTFATDGDLASRKSVNYTRPVTMVTEDTGVSIGRNGEKMTVLEDYEFVSVEFPAGPWVYTGVPHNINADGSWTALTAGDGTFLYKRDTDYSHFPDFRLSLLRNGEWEDYAVVSWSTGEAAATLADGSVVTGGIVDVPADTENFRVTVKLENTDPDAEANTAIQAALDYDIRPVIRLKKTAEMEALIAAGFANSNTPEIAVYNSAEMTATVGDSDTPIVDLERAGYDSIRGYTTDTMVYPYKESEQTLKDVDVNNRLVTIHYSARVEERSVINDKKTYEQAIADGRLVAEIKGVFRDLLPKGVTPVLDSIALRSGDKVLDAYTIVNYKNSGRTLLVVEAELQPVPERYKNGDLYYYMDVPAISFDATYGFDSITDYGDTIHNVISFESANAFIGTEAKYCGEPDDPYEDNNIATKNAFADETEKQIMKDLDPDRDDPSFVYAGTETKIDILSAARTSLFKDVMTNNDGVWSDGLYYGYPDENKRTVYEGGVYAYRLRMMPNVDTIAKDMIIFDSLENFYAGDGNDEIDVDAPRWQGTLLNVDVSQLEAKGCLPVVYYSTVADLELSDETDPDKADPLNTDIHDEDIWVKREDYKGSLADVKAIAVDASRGKDGSFELQPAESAVVIINMQAPSGEEAAGYIAQKGDWGDSANAYNNAYLIGTTIDVNTGEEESNDFVRKDYTKVGLMEYRYVVEKAWDDDDDRDGVRPESVTVHLLADGEDTGLSLELPVVDAETGEKSWTGSFDHIPYTDAEGNHIHYTVREDVPEGYTSEQMPGEERTAITNTHEPERTAVSGIKQWLGEDEGVRPGSIKVQLYADDKYVRSVTVKPDADGSWSFTFDDLLKYRDQGTEIVYTVKELRSGALLSYVSETEGTTITNTYHPYGDLKVSKTVTDVSEISAEQEFTFTFTFTRNEDGEEKPVFSDYAYAVLDSSGEEVSTGTVANNGQIRIRGGQTIHVKEIDEYVQYHVTEAEAPGFKAVRIEGDEGTIAPNRTAEAYFENRYAARGQVNLSAEKMLKWHEIQRYQFRFDLYEIQEDGSEKLVRTGSTDRADQVVKDDEGGIEYSTAVVTFGALRYTQADHGKTFTYKVKEADSGKAGYTYDDTEYYMTVTVTDNGDGTLTLAQTAGDMCTECGFKGYLEPYVAMPITDGINIVTDPKVIDMSNTMKYMGSETGTGMIWSGAEAFAAGKPKYQAFVSRVGELGKASYASFTNPATHKTYDYVSEIDFVGTDAELDRCFRAFLDSMNGGWHFPGGTPQDLAAYKNGIGRVLITMTNPGYRGNQGDFVSIRIEVYPKCTACEGDGIVQFDGSATFTNEYKATGELVLRAWKDLPGRTLQENEFRFQLLDEKGGVLQTAGNNADGTVTFAALQYDQTDIGKTYQYGVQEVKGTDSTVNYDDTAYGYTVTVVDNGDGTLSFSQGEATPIYGDAEECPACHGENSRYYLPLGNVTILQHENPQLLEKLGSLMSQMSEKGLVISEGPEMTGTCEGTDTDILTAFNEVLSAAGSSRRAGAHHTLCVKTMGSSPAMLSPDVAVSYSCSVCQASGVCPVCNGEKVLSTTVTDTVVGTGIRTYTEFKSAVSVGTGEAPLKTTQIYARLCEIGTVTFLDQQASDYGHYYEWEWAGLPYSADQRSLSAYYEGADAELAALFGIPAETETWYKAEMILGGNYGHGGTQYILRATCGVETVDCPECDGDGKVQVIVGWNTEEGELPVFTNTLKDGSLAITKYVTDTEGADPDQEFRFRVKLRGEGLTDGKIEYELRQAAEAQSGEDTDEASAPAGSGGQTPQAGGSYEGETEEDAGQEPAVKTSLPQTAGEDIASGTCRGVNWRITSDYELILGQAGTRQSFANLSSGTLLSEESWPWHEYRSQITKISLAGDIDFAYPQSATSGRPEKVQSARYMFADMTSLTAVDFTTFFFSGNQIQDLSNMFSGCSALKELDMSRFYTKSATNLNSMFADCTNLTALDLSHFKTDKVTQMVWMFQNCKSLAEVNVSSFDTAACEYFQGMFYHCEALTELDLSSFSSRKARNSNEMLGGCLKLAEITFGNRFRFYSNPDIPSEHTADTESPGKWVDTADPARIYTSAQLGRLSAATLKGTWKWYFPEYTVSFTAEGATGAMPAQTYRADKYGQLPINKFRKFGAVFDHWVLTEKNGTAQNGSVTYKNQAIINANTYKNNDKITLEAAFTPLDTSVNMQNGEFYLTLHADETAVFSDLPAGTVYEVYEETPDGWVLVRQSGTSGIIEPLNTAEAVFTNQYEPGVTTAQLVGRKTLDGSAAKEGAFRFTLTESGNEEGTVTVIGENGEEETTFPLTVPVMSGGVIRFPVIKYTEPGTHTYSIREVTESSESILYDEHTETVTVEVTANGEGALSAAVTYEEDGAVFANRTRPGELKIHKSGTNVTAANQETSFTFRVLLRNSKGQPVSDGTEISWQVLDSEGAPVDDGTGAAKTAVSENGIIYVSCRAGESILITSLDSGLRYELTEVDVPAGWTQADATIRSGQIQAGGTRTEEFQNTYNAEGEVYLTAHKLLRDQTAAAGQFSFALCDESGEVLQTVTNDEVDTAAEIMDADGEMTANPWSGTAPVRFDAISYTIADAGRTYTYTIKEIAGDDENIVYDGHVETVTVKVEDKGSGELSTTVSYDEDGALFTNEMRPTALKISKRVTGIESTDKRFAFDLSLKDAEGGALTDLTAQRYVGKVSHTDNIDDKGNKITDYENRKIYADVVTLPGCDSIHVKVQCSNARGRFWIWAGAHEEVFRDSYTDEFNPNMVIQGLRLYGLNYGPLITREFDVEGDSLSVLYQSDTLSAETFPSYDENTNYGYYMEISGQREPGGTETVADGDTIYLGQDEYLLIDGLPNGGSYQVTEQAAKDWTLTGEEGSSGTFTSGETSEAAFTNTYEPQPYHADGEAQITVYKTLKGGIIKEEDEFTFELLNEAGDVIQTAQADAFGAESSSVTFTPLEFTEEDMDGETEKVFRYYVREQNGTDPLVVYDDHRELEITVTVTDDGEGHLTPAVAYGEAEEIRFINERKAGLRIRKLDAATLAALPEAEFTIRAAAGAAGEEAGYIKEDGTFTESEYPLTTDEKGRIRIANMPAGTYTLHELRAPAGYLTADDTEFTVYDGQVLVAGEPVSEITVQDPQAVEVSVSKVWDDAEDQDGMRPANLKVELLADGEKAAEAILAPDEKGNWAHTFTGLPKYAEGAEIEYTVRESVTGYTAATVRETYTAADGATPGTKYTVTNTHVPSVVTVSGTKTWSGDQPEMRPESIRVWLYADGRKAESATVTPDADGVWQYSFTDLPEYQDGVKIVYTVAEEAIGGYAATVKGYDIINTYAPEKININGVKIWDDDDDRDGLRPESITVRLLADGTESQSLTVRPDPDGRWTFAFTGLDRYRAGKEIAYSVTEEVPAGYESAVDGYTVTNTHEPEKTEVRVVKLWDDQEDQDGKRPTDLSIELLADGEKVQTAVLTPDKEGSWTCLFTGLPRKAAGKDITYTVREVMPEGYELADEKTAAYTTADGSDAQEITLTNRHEPETIRISGTKLWEDADDQDGIRPDHITVYLLADGARQDSTEVRPDENGDWNYSFGELPVYADGEKITYTVEEEKVPGYQSAVSGFVIGNVHTPETTAVRVTKTWDDQRDEDGIRPDRITVKLLAGGKEVRSAELTAADGWQYTFTELPRYKAGREIVYSVTEVVPAGYTAEIKAEGDGFTIRNSHEPEGPEHSRTGDASRMPLWLALFGGAALLLAVLAVRRHRTRG